MKYIKAPQIEASIGIKYYVTSTPGTLGEFRRLYEDFYVKEILSTNIKRFKGEGGHVLFKLVKKGIDTFSALEAISKEFNVPFRLIGYSGMKDAHAITLQYITIPLKYLHEVRVYEFENFKLIPIDLFKRKLSSRDIQGNKFVVTVRNCRDGYEDIIKHFIHELKILKGLPSFYGHQRFGTIRPITHIVGKMIVNRKWFDAILNIVGNPSPHESENAHNARKYFQETLDVEGTLKILPKRLTYERIVLEHLLKHPNDYIGAIRRLPFHILKLFVNAYQSYLFNLILSKRLELGLNVNEAVDGDIVVRGVQYERCSKRKVIDPDFERILVPVLGYDSRIPSGSSGEIINEVLEVEGLTLSNFKIKEIPQISCRGTLRPTPMVVHNFAWSPLTRNSYRVRFMLERGMYATIVLRELIKGDPLKY